MLLDACMYLIPDYFILAYTNYTYRDDYFIEYIHLDVTHMGLSYWMYIKRPHHLLANKFSVNGPTPLTTNFTCRCIMTAYETVAKVRGLKSTNKRAADCQGYLDITFRLGVTVEEEYLTRPANEEMDLPSLGELYERLKYFKRYLIWEFGNLARYSWGTVGAQN